VVFVVLVVAIFIPFLLYLNFSFYFSSHFMYKFTSLQMLLYCKMRANVNLFARFLCELSLRDLRLALYPL